MMRFYSKKTGYSLSLLLMTALLFFSAPPCCNAQDTTTAEKLEASPLWQKAAKIHEEAIVIDTHCDTPLPIHRGFDIGQRSDKGNLDLIRMKEGGLDAAFFAIFTSSDEDHNHPSKRAHRTIDEITAAVKKYPDLAAMAYSPEDIRSIHKAGKRAILIGMENGSPIEGNLELLHEYHRLGVRYIGLTHWNNNDLCDAATSEIPKWKGLSPFGKEVIKEMNRLGIMVDVSHSSDDTVRDILAISRAPIIASHSCVRAICNSPRNLTDELIKAIAQKGGVIQINFYSGFLDDGYNMKASEIRKKLAPEYQKLKEKYQDDQGAYWSEAFALWAKHAPDPPKIETLIDHIDHVAKLVGADHVGLGSDFDGAGSFPEGLNDVTGYPLITYHLLQRGYSEEDIKKILGGNLLRVFEEVMKAAHRNEKS